MTDKETTEKKESGKSRLGRKPEHQNKRALYMKPLYNLLGYIVIIVFIKTFEQQPIHRTLYTEKVTTV